MSIARRLKRGYYRLNVVKETGDIVLFRKRTSTKDAREKTGVIPPTWIRVN